MAPTLTERQQQVLDYLSQDPPMHAKKIAEELGITRNAVYQQIAALKKKGALSPMFTPSGEVRAAAGTTRAEEIVGFVTGGNGVTHDPSDQLEVVRELVEQNSRLIAQNERLVDVIASMTSASASRGTE